MVTLSRAYLFPEREGQVLVLDHVLDLLLHRHREQHDPIQQQHGPEHGQIKHGKEGHGETYQQRLHRRAPVEKGKERESESVSQPIPSPRIRSALTLSWHHAFSGAHSPKLELRQPSHKGFEFLVALGWELGSLRVRINLRGEKPNEEVQVVYSQAVCHDVEPSKKPDLTTA